MKMSPGAGGYKVGVFLRSAAGGRMKRVELNNSITLQRGDDKSPVQQQLDSSRM